MGAGSELLIVAAHDPELQPLRERLAGGGAGELVCHSVGVGLAAAAAGTARLLSATRPGAVLLTGSCGLYPGAGPFTPGEVVVGSELQLLDSACLGGQAAMPAPVRGRFACDPALRGRLLAAGATRELGVATTLGITTDDGLAATLGRPGRVGVENLEAHGVAQACHDAGVPLGVLLGVTNEVGSRGRAQWQAHRQRAAEACARVILRLIRADVA